MSKKKATVIPPLITLSRTVIKGEAFKPWKGGARSYEPVIQRFIDLNRDRLAFLGISVRLISKEHRPCLELITSGYAGAVPIRSPQDGKEIDDIIVIGRFGEDSSSILDLLEEDIQPDYALQWTLKRHSDVSPPVYMECCRFIDLYLRMEKVNWRKFSNEPKVRSIPNGGTDWNEYAVRTFLNPSSALRFRNRENILTTRHVERAEVNFVLRKAIEILRQPKTPTQTKMAYRQRIDRLSHLLLDEPVKSTAELKIHTSDPVAVKQLKLSGNHILNDAAKRKVSWRLDYSKFFEIFVQYLCRSAARIVGRDIICNPHFSISGNKLASWIPAYLEPDIIVGTKEEGIIVDAKYKSHFFNFGKDSEDLQDSFRHDLHQVLAYTTLINRSGRSNTSGVNHPTPVSAPACNHGREDTPDAVIIYPYTKYAARTLRIGYGSMNKCVVLVGVPFTRASIAATVESLSRLF